MNASPRRLRHAAQPAVRWLGRLLGARTSGDAPGACASGRLPTEPASGQADTLPGDDRFHQLFQHSPLAQSLVDAEGRVVDINRAFVRSFGYTLADVPTLDDWSRQAFPDPVYRSTVLARRALVRQKAGDGAPVDCGEYRIRCKDGSERTTVVQLVMLGAQMLTSWTDVTAERAAAQQEARHRAAAAEEQRRARLASLNLIEDALAARRRLEAANAALQDLSQAIEQSAQAVAITDRDERIAYVNDAFTALTGYRRDEAIGQPATMLGNGRMAPADLAALRATLDRGETWRGEFTSLRRDGRLAVDAAIVTPLRDTEGGAVQRFMLLLEDVTERRRQGEELERHRHHLEELVASRTAELEAARAAAEAANLAKSQFLANMSHEIRTPLNAVIGLAHLLRLEPLSATQRVRLDKVDAAAQHLLSVISDILDLSKIEAGQMELEQVDFALPPLLDGVRAMVADAAAAKGLALKVETDPLPPLLRGDPTRLRQALLNFAANAVKFTARGGVVLRARLLGETDGRAMLRFEVEDSGIGIAPEALARLFEPFAQGDSSTSRRFGGTGLGLAITRRLVQHMGGEVGASSQPGQGSRFWFTLALDLTHLQAPGSALSEAIEAPPRPGLPAAPPEDPARALQRQHPGARVLVVEDNPVNREVADALLRAVGLQVETAESGDEALHRLGLQRPDLVLMDMQLPGMDGLEATRRIRRDPALAGLPVVAMTANAFAEDRQACLAAGMDDFVVKPVNPDALYAALLRGLAGRQGGGGGGGRGAGGGVPPAAVGGGPVGPGRSPGAAGPATAAEPSLSALQRLLGDEARVALRRLRGDMPRYLRLLRQFVQRHQDDAQRLPALLHAPEDRGAAGLVHELKGAAATLGAAGLARLAAEVEQALGQARSPAALLPSVRALQGEMRRLADGLAALAPVAEPVAPASR